MCILWKHVSYCGWLSRAVSPRKPPLSRARGGRRDVFSVCRWLEEPGPLSPEPKGRGGLMLLLRWSRAWARRESRESSDCCLYCVHKARLGPSGLQGAGGRDGCRGPSFVAKVLGATVIWGCHLYLSE